MSASAQAAQASRPFFVRWRLSDMMSSPLRTGRPAASSAKNLRFAEGPREWQIYEQEKEPPVVGGKIARHSG